ncbi:hypothetical protein [Celeribacter arenosi]|uniref:Uncharacterized protein n=1 Tax=Celeribacter arenosi TaxID=792649 RepID=A0ABP7K4H2_9RHOB
MDISGAGRYVGFLAAGLVAVAGVFVSVGWGLVGAVIVFAAGFLAVAAFAVLHHGVGERVILGLRIDRYHALYAMALEMYLRRLREFFRVDDPADTPDGERASAGRLFFGSMSFGMFDRTMQLAVVYPYLLFIMAWAFGSEGAYIGERWVLTPPDPWWIGPATLVLTGLVVFSSQFSSLAPKNSFLQRFPLTLAYVAFGLAAALVYSKATEIAVPLAIVLASAIVVAVSGVSALGIAVGVAILGTGSVAGLAVILLGTAGFSETALMRVRAAWRAPLIVAIYTVVLIGAAGLLGWDEEPLRSSGWTSIFFFLAVAPMVNAVFDSFGVATTLATATRGLRSHPLLWGVVDAVMACVFFVGLGIAFITVLTVIEWLSGVSFVDIDGVFLTIRDLSKTWWIYVMLFSTALPTFVHFLVASLSLQAVMPRGLRDGLSARIVSVRRELRAGRGDLGQLGGAIAGLAALWAVSLMVVMVPLALLVWVFRDSGVAMVLSSYQVLMVEFQILLEGIFGIIR